MEINTDKIDDTILALLYLTSFPDHGVTRAWKGQDWDAMDRLNEKGMISDPKSKARSVVLTEEGARRSKELFHKFFEMAG
ncbi:MAG TPA: DUF6429 family protein [Bacteroidota bacterium]|jgi:hypothetical protein